MNPEDARPESDEIGSPQSGMAVQVHHPVHADSCWWCQKQQEILTSRWTN